MAAKKHNLPVNHPAGALADINKRISQGFRFFQACNDLALRAAGARDLLSKVPRDEAGAPNAYPAVKQ